ncbi:MAG: hydroxymethylglutaryl-CoA lyase [Thermoleophilia bacterium]|nr:hydroxymethylglutaryl-CoA lyase [Thermoleophilia bacterium]
MPEFVRVIEVGPRDGLQNEADFVATATKIELVERLSRAGAPVVEVTSFVNPKAVPQLADAGEVLDGMTLGMGENERATEFPVLVPNMRGYEAAREHGVTSISVFTAASESFNRRNINASIAESIERFAPVVDAALTDGVHVRGYVSTAFGCPFEGEIARSAAADVVERLMALGIRDISVGDTIGVATPADIEPVLLPILELLDVDDLALHLHDTRGTALANVWEGLRLGVTTFDASISGLGGCPFAPGATGNLATEDLVFLLHRAGIETGIDLEALIETSRWISGQMRRVPGSHVAKARLWPWPAELSE